MNDNSGILDRTFAPLRRALFGVRRQSVRETLSESGIEALGEKIESCLDRRGGEVSSRSRAVELGLLYLALDDEGKTQFLRLLATEYGVDRPARDLAMAAIGEAADEHELARAERNLRAALVPRRAILLTQFNALEQGVKFLVDMRADLLRLGRGDVELQDLGDDLRDLLASWFDIGFLELRQITWDSSAALLERLIAYEAVHEIRSWDDLKNRLDSDRRCFAFFHPRMPDEPLIFVEVALVNGLADNIGDLLDEDAPETDPVGADTAIFYSISNAQAGLAGVSFGNFLIKRVVDELRRDLPNLKKFATLSPIPGFRRWLEHHASEEGSDLMSADEIEAAGQFAPEREGSERLIGMLDDTTWVTDSKRAALLQPILMRNCARYLLMERRNGHAADPVAHFHLSNGARLERLNWLGDRSANGLKSAAGMMVNYLYRLPDIDKNHEAYTGEGKIAAATQIRKLTKS
jgi:malonyl-CoA decarboxylase